MTRNTHDIVNDHFGTAQAEQIAGGTATSGYIPVSTGPGTPAAWTAPASAPAPQVKVSVDDTTPGYLDVKVVAGTNVTIAVLNDGFNESLEISATGGGGGGGGWSTFSGNGVTLDSGRDTIYDDTQSASIFLGGGEIDLYSDSSDIGIYADAGHVVDMQLGNGLVLPHRSSDPSAVGDGQIFYRSDSDFLRLQSAGVWKNVETIADSGFATVPSGSTVITVTPSLGYDPGNARPITVTPVNNPTNDPGWFWVDNVGFDTFDLHVRNDPGSGGAQFTWRVMS